MKGGYRQGTQYGKSILPKTLPEKPEKADLQEDCQGQHGFWKAPPDIPGYRKPEIHKGIRKHKTDKAVEKSY